MVYWLANARNFDILISSSKDTEENLIKVMVPRFSTVFLSLKCTKLIVYVLRPQNNPNTNRKI